MKNNLYMYQETQDMLYLEYIINNIKEIFRLKQLSEEYYNKYYYILPWKKNIIIKSLK